MFKTCKRCGQIKDFDQFPNHKSTVDGKFSWCKACKKISNRNFYLQNKEYFAKSIRKYNKENREWFRNYENQKRKSNLNFKIAKSLRDRVSKSIRNGSAVRDLGCFLDDFVKHIESKFNDGMNWENYGHKGWHIDHIKPLAKFDLSNRKEFLEACHYTNLQPLWWQENLSKGAK